MASERILKPSKWLSNKSFRLSLHRRRSRSNSCNSSSTLRSPNNSSPCTTPKNIRINRDAEENELMKEVFRHFDGDGDGKISALELRTYLASIGEYMSQEEAEGVIHDLDSDGDNLLDFEDFTKLMKSEQVEDLKKAFEMFVWEKGSGYITPKGLQRMFHRLGDHMTYDECVTMIDAFDIDRNGVLDFNEFHQMMA